MPTPRDTSSPLAGISPALAAQLAAAQARDPELRRPSMNGNMQRYREMTIDEMLLENRVIFLIGEIHHGSAMGVVMRLLYLESQKPGQDINLYINSPGGSVDDTLAMIDTMNHITSPVSTYCIGHAMSGGALTLAAGTKGKRFCLPHSKVMIHQPLGGIGGQATDIQIQVEDILKTKDELNLMLSQLTGQPLEKICVDVERDKFFSAEEAKAYGLVDDVVRPREKKAGV